MYAVSRMTNTPKNLPASLPRTRLSSLRVLLLRSFLRSRSLTQVARRYRRLTKEPPEFPDGEGRKGKRCRDEWCILSLPEQLFQLRFPLRYFFVVRSA